MNPDFEFAFQMMQRAMDDAYKSHERKDFESSQRHMRMVSRALADMRRANWDMMRWTHQAGSI